MFSKTSSHFCRSSPRRREPDSLLQSSESTVGYLLSKAFGLYVFANCETSDNMAGLVPALLKLEKTMSSSFTVGSCTTVNWCCFGSSFTEQDSAMAWSNFFFFVLADVKSMSRTFLYSTLFTAFGNTLY